MTDIDEFQKDCIRREILAFYERGELHTISSLLVKVREPPTEFQGCSTTLNKIVRNRGFRYKKVESGRAMLMERKDIVIARSKDLKEIDSNRQLDQPIPEIFLDETWLNQN